MKVFHHQPHPHIEHRKNLTSLAKKVPKNSISRFNLYIGEKITHAVGTMWCAYAFALIAFISLPEAIHGGTSALISWIAQTFLQLVLLSIIMVGQKVEAAAADVRADNTFKDAEAILHEALEIQKHLEAQDALLQALINSSRKLSDPTPAKE